MIIGSDYPRPVAAHIVQIGAVENMLKAFGSGALSARCKDVLVKHRLVGSLDNRPC